MGVRLITGIYFLLLLIMSVEDYKSCRVNNLWVLCMWLLGLIKIVIIKENRWVTVALTCICFTLLWLLYFLVSRNAHRFKTVLHFGGADVKLIPAMMLVRGWDKALTGVFVGLLFSLVFYLGMKKKEIPLIPWMTIGSVLVEIIYLFS